MPEACRVFVCIDVEMSDANVVCANVYIRISGGRRVARVTNPGRALMKGAIMHFSLVTAVDGASERALERTTYEDACCDWLLVSVTSGPSLPNSFRNLPTDTRRQRRAGRHAGARSRLTAFYCRVIRSLTARPIDVRSFVRPSVYHTF